MGKYKIKQDKNLCIGCGACVAICSKNWKLKDGKAYFKEEISELECNKKAEENCPVSCIHVEKI